jgi:hypothetical protein
MSSARFPALREMTERARAGKPQKAHTGLELSNPAPGEGEAL